MMVTQPGLRWATCRDILQLSWRKNTRPLMYQDDHGDAPQNALINLLLGFFGVLGALLILPKALKFFSRRFAFGIVSEIIAIVITGLLTEKLVSQVGRDGDEQATPAHRTPTY